MALKHRLTNLERRSPINTQLPDVVFVNFVDHDGTEPSLATIVGSQFGQIKREAGETADKFRRRVYAMKAVNKPVEEMTDAELMVAMAAADERVAKELAETISVSDETLERMIG
ncbi:hypothetical protein [Tropicimonas aquimaris]|uniref:Uncharacterized protein n=1 Tax=Tropicimonas aquimaris TaxID=914152 RepID=A0ABW3IRQ7_9RHOB